MTYIGFVFSATDNVRLVAYCMKLDDSTPPQEYTSAIASSNQEDPCIVRNDAWEGTVTDTLFSFNTGETVSGVTYNVYLGLG